MEGSDNNPMADVNEDAAVTAQETKRHFARNTLSNVLFIGFNVLAGMYMVSFQIAHLGKANYGMAYLANQFVSYLQVFTVVVVGTIGRFVTLHMAKGDTKTARSYFNTQLVAVVWLIVALIPIIALISYFTPSFLRIPPGQERNTQILFFLVQLAFVFTLPMSAFQVAMFVRQRFDLRNGVGILNEALRYGIWIILFAVLMPSLWQIGVGTLAGAFAAFAASWMVFRRLLPDIKLRLGEFDRHKFLEMIRMGSWMFVNQLGVVLYLSIDALVINMMLGAGPLGEYGPIARISTMLRSISSIMANMVTPIIIAYYGRQEWSALIRTSTRAVKFTALAMAIPLGIVCGFAEPFVTRWLGPGFESSVTLIWLMIPHLVINLGVQPLFSIYLAANRMAVPGFVTIGGGLVMVGTSVAFIKFTNWGIYGVALAGLISLSVKNAVFTPIYASRILKCSVWPFYRSMAMPVIVFAATAAAALWLARSYDLVSYARLAAAGLILVVAFLPVTCLVFLNSDDRRFLWRLTPWKQKGSRD